MAGGFSNPIIGGGGALVYPSIHSPNFNVANPSASPNPSWGILKNGLAYFFGLVLSGGTITGTDYIINTSGMFFYSGTPAAGNLIASIAPASGNDGFGNFYRAGFSVQENTFGTSANLAANALEFLNASGTPVQMNLTPSGLFLYSPGGGLSNLIVSLATAAGTDAYGNAYPKGLNATTGTISGTTFKGTNFIINSSGTVGYSAAPAANDMLYSDAPAAFTDAFGNSVLAGVTTYGKSGLTYYALNQLPGIDAAGTFGAVTTVYTATSQAGPWTAGSQLNLSASNHMSLLADLAQIFGISGAPSVQLHSGSGLLSAAAVLSADAQGALTVAVNGGLTGQVPLVQVDNSTHAAGNDALAHDITKSWSVPAGDGAATTSYVIRALATLTIGQTAAETLTIGADINGVQTPLATLGASFNGSTLSATYDIPLTLTLDVDAVGAGTPQVYLDGPLANTSANRLATNSANMSGHSNATAWNKANANTLAIYAQWGGAGGSVQNIQTIRSKFYREGP